MLRPSQLEYHVPGHELSVSPPLIPLSSTWISSNLYQMRRDFVCILLEVRDSSSGDTPERWVLSASSRNEARQWVDALETLGVQRFESLNPLPAVARTAALACVTGAQGAGAAAANGSSAPSASKGSSSSANGSKAAASSRNSLGGSSSNGTGGSSSVGSTGCAMASAPSAAADAVSACSSERRTGACPPILRMIRSASSATASAMAPAAASLRAEGGSRRASRGSKGAPPSLPETVPETVPETAQSTPTSITVAVPGLNSLPPLVVAPSPSVSHVYATAVSSSRRQRETVPASPFSPRAGVTPPKVVETPFSPRGVSTGATGSCRQRTPRGGHWAKNDGSGAGSAASVAAQAQGDCASSVTSSVGWRPEIDVMAAAAAGGGVESDVSDEESWGSNRTTDEDEDEEQGVIPSHNPQSERTEWSGPDSCQLISLWLRLVVHSLCATLGPCLYEAYEVCSYPCQKPATALRVVFSWCSLAQWSAHNATPACQLGELGLPAVQETLSLHRPAPEETKTSEENPYSCPALDNEAAAMADWSYRDAHEFALGASLAFTTILEVLVCIGVFILSLGSLQVDSVSILMRDFASAFLSMLLVYSLFVAARWQPPAVQCRCITVVPSAVYRLLALACCLAYATSATSLSLQALADLSDVLALQDTTPGRGFLITSSSCKMSYHGLQALLDLFNILVVVHRLWLQTAEDDRPWLIAHERKLFASAGRQSRRNLVPGSAASPGGAASMV